MKKNILKALVIIVLFFVEQISFAQQTPQFTHYMYNPSLINPAFAGYRNSLSVTLLHRSQWIGLDGAPNTQTLSLTSPLKNEKIALGLNVSNDRIGAFSEMNSNIDFSYTIIAEKANFSFGIKAGIQSTNLDPSKLSIQDVSDNDFLQLSNQISPQIGIGVMVEKSNLFLGFSVLNLIETNHKNVVENTIYNANERRSFYGTVGYVYKINEKLDLKSTLLTKMVFGAPLQIDLSSNLLINKKLTIGGAYRLDAAVSALLGYQISESLMLGLAYDYDNSPLTKLNSGSGEIILRYDILNLLSNKRILNPRIF